MLARQRCPVDVEPPAHAQVGREGEEGGEDVAVEGGHGTDLDERRLAHGRPAATPGDRPRGVRVQAVRGLGELEVGALGRAQERVEEAAGEGDVVVDHEQPVAFIGRVVGEQRVEVLELAARAGRRGHDIDLVAALEQSRSRGVHQRSRPLDAEREHAPPRRLASRRAL